MTTEHEPDCREENEYLRNIIRQHTAEICNLQSDLAELRAWMERMPKLKMKAKPVKFIRDFPAFETLTQIKCQLWHNEPNRSGKHGGPRHPEWNLKVGFWTLPLNDDTKEEWPDGTVKPFFFPLYHLPHSFKLIQDEGGEQTLLHNTIAARADVCDLIGARKLTKYNVIKGSRFDGNQLAVRRTDGSLIIGCLDWKQEMGQGTTPKQDEDEPKQSEHVWVLKL